MAPIILWHLSANTGSIKKNLIKFTKKRCLSPR